MNSKKYKHISDIYHISFVIPRKDGNARSINIVKQDVFKVRCSFCNRKYRCHVHVEYREREEDPFCSNCRIASTDIPEFTSLYPKFQP